MKILVSGATGFIGKTFVAAALECGWHIRAALRRDADLPAFCEKIIVGDIDGSTDWSGAFDGCDAAVHLAARVHVMRETAPDPEQAFDRINAYGTANFARQAAAAGLPKFLFLSTAKVLGEEKETPYTESDAPRPNDPFAFSKWKGEEELKTIQAQTGMSVAILRAPLVYGPGVKANFLNLMKGVDKGLPFPLGCASNRRSLIYAGNLADAVITALSDPNAAGKTFLVSDGEDILLPDLICRLAKALDRPCRLIPVPLWTLRLAGRVFHKTGAIDRLLGSFCVDPSDFCKTTGWKPPYSLDEGLRQTAVWFRSRLS